jgi:NitT/TauT family transport system substrate-binding protein
MKRYLLVALAAVLTMVGCGDDGGSGGSGPGGETATVKVGVLPISDVAPLYLGMQKGFFDQEQIKVEPQVVQGGSEVVTGVVSGSLDFGFAATEPLIVARDKGLPVQIVTTGNQAAKDPDEDWSAIMVAAKSPIRSLKDLEGKTVATNALQNTNQLAALELFKRAGADVSKVKWLEIPFPDMPAALESGRVDAATPVEPFVTVIKGAGGHTITPLFAGVQPGMTIGVYFSNEKQISEDPDLVERFATAMNRSLEYAQAHRDEAREIIKTYTKIPPEALAKIKLPLWSSDLNRPSIELMAGLAHDFGYTDSTVDVGRLIWSGADG